MISGKSIFAIFTIAIVAMFAGSLSSCNSDEEYKECLDTNTLAKGMMTRASENNSVANQFVSTDTIYTSYMFKFTKDTQNQDLIMPEDTLFNYNSPVKITVKLYSDEGKPVVFMLDYDTYSCQLFIDGVGFEADVVAGRYTLCAYAHDCYMFTYSAKVENRIFGVQ